MKTIIVAALMVHNTVFVVEDGTNRFLSPILCFDFNAEKFGVNVADGWVLGESG